MESAASDRSGESDEGSETLLPLHEQHSAAINPICDCDTYFAQFSAEMIRRIESEQPDSISAMRTMIEQDPDHRYPANHAQSHEDPVNDGADDDASDGASDGSSGSEILDTSMEEAQICTTLMLFAGSLPCPPFAHWQIRDCIRALHFVHHVTSIYPPYEEDEIEVPRIVQVQEALQATLTHGTSPTLWREMIVALNGNQDLLLKFRACMVRTGFQSEYWSQDINNEILENWHNRGHVEAGRPEVDPGGG